CAGPPPSQRPGQMTGRGVRLPRACAAIVTAPALPTALLPPTLGGSPRLEAVGVTVGGSCSVPEAARQLGISERAVRFRITSGALAATRTAQGWQVALPAAEAGGSAVAEGGSPEAPEAVGGNGTVGDGGSEGGSAEAPAVGPTALDV